MECYGWDSACPKSRYRCAACGAVGDHYLCDCDEYGGGLVPTGTGWRPRDEERRKRWTEQVKGESARQRNDRGALWDGEYIRPEAWNYEKNWYI